MAILSFQKPDKIVLQKATEFDGQFEFRPLEPGFGLTIGNAVLFRKDSSKMPTTVAISPLQICLGP
jgi:DNA-directed RNA polymerase alpha subunit